MNTRSRQLITFALVGLLVLVINRPAPLFAIGEYDGFWSGPETVTVPGYGTETFTTGTLIYQEDQSTLYLMEPEIGTIQLIKSGGQWVLPAPISTTLLGFPVNITEVSITFHSFSYLTGSFTLDVFGVTGSASISFTKQSCQSLADGSTVSGLSGGMDSFRCYEIDLPSGATDLDVQTSGGSGDCDLYLIYHRPPFDFYPSENASNQEQITLASPDPGKWYIILVGFFSYSGLNLSVSYVGVPAPTANFTADATEGPVPLSVNFTDHSTGSITSWDWDFGDGSTGTGQNPSHTYSVPGTYTVSLTVSGPGGSDQDINVDFISVFPKTMPWIPLLLLDD
jgi:hypothetical protein